MVESKSGQPLSPSFGLNIIERPAQRLSRIIAEANYEGPEEFMIKALQIFESALEPGAGGKIIVENKEAGKRLVFDIKNKPFNP